LKGQVKIQSIIVELPQDTMICEHFVSHFPFSVSYLSYLQVNLVTPWSTNPTQ
jgi:hypothetical protein